MKGMDRFDRQYRFFGKRGQQKLRQAHVAAVGVGGLGSALVQQLAYLGVGGITLIDDDIVEHSNLNRLIGATKPDAESRIRKTDMAECMIRSVDPDIGVKKIPFPLRSKEVFAAILQCNYVFGCLDNDGARQILSELCIAYEIPYIDLASEIFVEQRPTYGGRIFVTHDENGCLNCYGEISPDEVQRDLETPESRKNRQAVYGIDKEALGDSGPSVVTINSVIASLAATEFMVMATGLRGPSRKLTYRGEFGSRVLVSDDNPTVADCYYCKSLRGKKEEANMERYVSTLPAAKEAGSSA